MKVHLHIGTHKTGTTAIQAFASNNSDWLFDAGYLYPTPELIGEAKTRSQWKLTNDISRPDNERQRRCKAIDLLRVANDKAMDAGKDIFISAENLYRLTPDETRRATEALETAFPAADFVVMCALRSQAEFAESLYKNAYRTYLRPPLPFDAWLAKSIRLFDYKKRIEDFTTPLDAQLCLVPYGVGDRTKFVPSFFARLGLQSLSASKEVEIKNLSLDIVDCIAKAEIMGHEIDPELGKAFNNFAARNKISTRYGFLDRDSEAAFSAQFSEGNAALVDIEPELGAVIGQQASPMARLPMDGEFRERVRQRVSAFRASKH